MLLGFKTELKINNQQRTALMKHCGVARHAWNWGLWLTKNILDHNRQNPQEKLKFPSAIDLHKLLVAMVKSKNEWYYECSKSAPQQALIALRDSWKRCFNKTAGVPKFKKKGKGDSFTLEGAVKILGNNKIQVPVIGVLKTYERLPQVKPKSVKISRQADRWFISFRRSVAEQTTVNTSIVGVDIGVKNLATLSNGEAIQGAKSYRKLEKKIARLQYLHRHKVKGSSNWKNAHIEIAKLHRKIANIRSYTLHKLTTLLAKNHGTVVIEDLNVSGMMANRKLAKSIQDMGFYEFRRQLTYKCKLYGSKLVVVDRWFPSSKLCSHCGAKKEILSLGERVFECDRCAYVIDRDLNAAINLSKTVS
ncbi:MAG: transposase [Microcoleus sp. PH2017_10_PVI_O_A]|uniref:RNA-guided endonuclease InsQ/TnpB family protein n=1 Tax=unclassified Microcoleus TaxID=2642155 RepID=UPI001DF02CCA|nr:MULTISPECIES: RNA-guided endonuclease TnpB family protein [unclassified Microcoleus]TAE84963.1 MAG: transposase [Oscillatoriales cyanobacterium]MCC3404304.1 transposase [Microcoleus sp. PH2017_10_PVI_O_A]MCC3458393.1 transposase [Microcoleus sp. PH2017_11_PCY_U_A]MCC3476731.1 transposase [Microcoleus sp. PH2017_12_PCY_D_A]MCC3526870.1 transposase [Microcoleus sp. PH2017_21_RUC_O_A]